MHIGFSISCYGQDSYVFSVPITATPEDIQAILGRTHPINGEPLTETELGALRKFTGDVEIGWDQNLSFFLEGHNIPNDDI